MRCVSLSARGDDWTECEFVFDVYEFCSTDYSSSAIDEESAPAIRETTFQDWLDSDSGESIGCRHDDCSKQ
jgi:hypothetical protein